MTQNHVKNLLGYGILIYALSLLTLIHLLSQLSLSTLKAERIGKQSNLIASSALVSTSNKNGDVRKQDWLRSIKNSFTHKALSYDTTEPETHLARPIPDFSSFNDIVEKKAAFVHFFHDIINEQNALQLRRREQLIVIKEKASAGNTLNNTENSVLTQLRTKYRIPKTFDTRQSIEELEARINIVPGSMILAQAATESAWGTSRFAKQANNFFGQWCFKPGCGIIPARRSPDAKHEIAKFISAESSIRAYFKNLNTYKTYKEFRDIRLAMAHKGESLKGLILVGGLMNYSERGEHYIDDLRSIIRFNKFDLIFGEQ